MADMDRLNALEGLVSEADAAAGPTPEQAQEQAAEVAAQAVEDHAARSWGQTAYAIGGLLAMFAPELRQVYTEDRCLDWGRSVVPVAEKYGWKADTSPELALALATFGLAAPTVVVIRHRLQHPDADKGGMLSQVRAWWRERRAAKAAKIAAEAAEKAGEGVSGGR